MSILCPWPFQEEAGDHLTGPATTLGGPSIEGNAGDYSLTLRHEEGVVNFESFFTN